MMTKETLLVKKIVNSVKKNLKEMTKLIMVSILILSSTGISHASTQSELFEDALDTKYIKINDDGSMSEEYYSSLQRSSTMEDGYHISDKGYGWILGNDESVNQTGFAQNGATVKLEDSVEESTTYSVKVGIETGIDTNIIKASIFVLSLFVLVGL